MTRKVTGSVPSHHLSDEHVRASGVRVTTARPRFQLGGEQLYLGICWPIGCSGSVLSTTDRCSPHTTSVSGMSSMFHNCLTETILWSNLQEVSPPYATPEKFKDSASYVNVVDQIWNQSGLYSQNSKSGRNHHNSRWSKNEFEFSSHIHPELLDRAQRIGKTSWHWSPNRSLWQCQPACASWAAVLLSRPQAQNICQRTTRSLFCCVQLRSPPRGEVCPAYVQ